MAIEQPDYTVVSTYGDVEFRQYEPYLVAETTIEGNVSFNASSTEGFRRLFRYITGGNRGSANISMGAVAQTREGEKIAMTAPVSQVNDESGWTVAFMLPSEFTLATAPQPVDARVRVSKVPGRLVAVLRYSGSWAESNYDAKRKSLLNTVESAGVDITGEPTLARYNAPYTPWFMRRNEVLVPVATLPVEVDDESREIISALAIQ